MIGLLHPGAMGAAVGACLTGRELKVGWVGDGRSPATGRRAAAAGLTDVGSLDRLLQACPVVLAVCPPHGALDLAAAVAGYRGVYVDANAISPATAGRVAALVEQGGGGYVDGGIIGPPPVRPGTTRLYLSGRGAEQVAGLFEQTALDARAVGDRHGTASALKMAYAGWAKGRQALLLAVRAAAHELDVEDLLLAEWAISQPGLESLSESAGAQAVEKGWRWSFELAEVADTFQAVGLPAGFGRAAEQVFDRMPADGGRSAGEPAHLAQALHRLRRPAP